MFLRFYNRNKIPLWKKYIDSTSVAVGLILMWKGVWNLADRAFSFIGNLWIENIISFLVGATILVLTDRFIEQFIDD